MINDFILRFNTFKNRSLCFAGKAIQKYSKPVQRHASEALQYHNPQIEVLQLFFYKIVIPSPQKENPQQMIQHQNEKHLSTHTLSACFQHLSEQELALLNKKKTQVIYEKGETLCKQGAFAPYVLYVLEGLAKVYIQTGARKQINVNIARTGDFIAFSSVFGNETHSYSAQALKDTRICMMDKDALKSVLMTNSSFAMQITARNFLIENQLLEIIKNLSYKQMRGKLATALCYLSSKEFLSENIFTHLTRKDIADFAGITQESAVKFLKEFEREKLLMLKGKDIRIEDREKLSLISKTG